MHLYTGPTTAFVEDATQNRIGQLLSDAFFGHFGYQPAPSEVRSWRNLGQELAARPLLDGARRTLKAHGLDAEAEWCADLLDDSASLSHGHP